MDLGSPRAGLSLGPTWPPLKPHYIASTGGAFMAASSTAMLQPRGERSRRLLARFRFDHSRCVVTSSRFVLWGLQAMCRDVFSFSFVASTGRS
jgi:hypothetical protein